MHSLRRAAFQASALRRLVHTESRIAALGYKLPELPQPVGAYTLGASAGGWVYLAGHLPFKEDLKSLHIGRVGVDYTEEEANALAKITGLELISSLKRAVGDLDRVKRIVKVNGYIACPPEFVALPAVLNGCSNLLGEVFEERGVHARAAVGVASLPLGVPLEIDLVALVEE
uniref:Endoribonuclease L-PSP/chorismate mutase-like domain-containing protein n=1 Tax=Haptolina brevifila TaxID=156173 RepID=A0A7S2I2C5_9EUKA|mmetsp:Transcript_60503/g.119856  ORF Transcript_60503/g.119856 Transcript_60503/m.119856 type:complete len:172 (+) Transcript_60503:23-538(+)